MWIASTLAILAADKKFSVTYEPVDKSKMWMSEGLG